MSRAVVDSGQTGYSLLEVLITMFVLAIGLLGLAGLQARAINAEVDASARGQALMLANDLSDRLAANLAAAKNPSVASGSYNLHSGALNADKTVVFDSASHTLTELGTGYSNACANTGAYATPALQMGCCAALTTIAARDICEFDLALKGNAEAISGSRVGGLLDVRACIYRQADDVYEVDVVWRGRDALTDIAASVTCGASAITSARRAVTRRFRVSNLNDS